MYLENLEPLKLLKIIATYSPIKSERKLHSIVYELRRKGHNINYNFINYSFGPFSKELENDLKLLVKLGLVKYESKGGSIVISISSKGLQLINALSSIVKRS